MESDASVWPGYSTSLRCAPCSRLRFSLPIAVACKPWVRCRAPRDRVDQFLRPGEFVAAAVWRWMQHALAACDILVVQRQAKEAGESAYLTVRVRNEVLVADVQHRFRRQLLLGCRHQVAERKIALAGGL